MHTRLKLSVCFCCFFALMCYGQDLSLRHFFEQYAASGSGYDSFESYSAGAQLNSLNSTTTWSGGTSASFTGGYVDRNSLTGLRTADDFESYANSAGLNGLNGGTGSWNGAYVDR